MKKEIIESLVVGLMLTSPLARAGDKNVDMVKLFTANKCNECHSLSKYGVKVDEGGEKADEEDGKAIDLTTEKRASEHDVAWTIKFLKKKEKIKGKKHKKRWPGDDGELDILAGWLDEVKAK